jgi:ABC-type polysaccharide/polyol phosphate export permease
VTGVGISWHIIFVPLIAIVEEVLILGLGLALGAMDAYVQDLEYLVNFIMMMGFYASPIVYQMDTFAGSRIATLIQLNPVTTIINAYRDVFFYHQIPDMGGLGVVFLIALVILLLGYLIFKKLEKGFAEQF